MLCSVLNSERAIKVNIQIERKYADHDEKIQKIFDAIRQLMAPPEEPKRRIGFHAQ
ncbi:MAG: hypothetical protein NT066_06950 [Candidatus Omnitrophica bacterium]|nr:hypothetical protein [Candidatus Omnitrophota bacterium]